jgi:hypothetical protein
MFHKTQPYSLFTFFQVNQGYQSIFRLAVHSFGISNLAIITPISLRVTAAQQAMINNQEVISDREHLRQPNVE